jgi:hypothetical protein
MKLLLGFVLFCFVAATLLRKRDFGVSMWMVFGLALLLSIGYYFFNQI